MMERSRFVGAIAVILWCCGIAPVAAEPGGSGGGAPAVGDHFTVEVDDARVLASLSHSEVAEQLRDWAVIATLARVGGTAPRLAGSLYELPPARLPYLDELYAFDYGPARRAYIGDRVLIFHDADDPAPVITLARSADRVRRETGAIPGTVELYGIHIDRDTAAIEVVREADIAGASLFSDRYGYHEATISDPDGLAQWLSQVDDLVYANIQSQRLTLGGRRFAQDPGKNLALEDVAALYVAQKQRLAEQQLVRAAGFGRALDSLGFSLDPVLSTANWDPAKPQAADAIQCARYDGDLQHTSVGMTMFYTDLLAKLWFGIDHEGLFPARALPGILTLPRIAIDDTFSKELQQRSEARLWFGPRGDALSKRSSSRGREFFFDPIIAKVFAAAKQQGIGDHEVQAPEGMRRVFASVNRHYRDLANYEPQYHRLNEILKWHAVTEAMAAAPGPWMMQLAAHRTMLPTDFFGWLEQHRGSLRIAESIHPRKELFQTTECIDRLRSNEMAQRGWLFRVEGGVKAGGKVPELSTGTAAARALHIRAEAEGIAGRPVPAGSQVNFAGASAARVRSGAGEFRMKGPRVDVAVKARTSTIRLETGGGEVLGMRLTAHDDAVTLKIEPGTFERMRRAAGAKSDGEAGEALDRGARNVVSFDDGTRVFRAHNEPPIAMVESTGARDDAQYQIASPDHVWRSLRSEPSAAVARRLAETKAIVIRRTDVSTARPAGVEIRATARVPRTEGAEQVAIRGAVKPGQDLVADILPDRVVIARPARMAAGEWARTVDRLTITPSGLDALRAGGDAIAIDELSAEPVTAASKIRRLLDATRGGRAVQASQEIARATTEWSAAERATVAEQLAADGHPAIAAKLRDPARRDASAILDHGVLRGVYRTPGDIHGKAVPLELLRDDLDHSTTYISDRARHGAAGGEVDMSNIVGDPHAGQHYSASVLDDDQIELRDDLLVIEDRQYRRVEPEPEPGDFRAAQPSAMGAGGGRRGPSSYHPIILIDLAPGCDDDKADQGCAR